MRRTSRIADLKVKQGRSGALCFVTVNHAIDVDGSLILEERQDIVYRDAAPPASQPAPTLPSEHGATRRAVVVSPPLLFRYSALTFNAHRIHYDFPYATEIEGYPGLVVHGPLQATWLINLATELRGKTPAAFTFRSASPVFSGQEIWLNATAEGAALKLWTTSGDGPIAMSAEASWA